MSAILYMLIYILGKFINNPTETDSDITVSMHLVWNLVNLMPTVAIGIRRMRDAVEDPKAWILLPVVNVILGIYRGGLEGDFRAQVMVFALGPALLEFWFQCRPSFDRKSKQVPAK